MDSSTASSRARSARCGRCGRGTCRARGGRLRPGGWSYAGARRDRPVDVARTRGADLREYFLGGRVDRLERLPVVGSTNSPPMNSPYDEWMSTIDRDSGAGAYSNCMEGLPLLVEGEVVRTGVAAGGHLLPLHEQVVEQAGGTDPEPVGIQPVGPGRLVDEDEMLDGVLGGTDAARRLDADLRTGRVRKSRTASSISNVMPVVAAGEILPVLVLMKSAPASMAATMRAERCRTSPAPRSRG